AVEQTPPAQSAVIGAANAAAESRDVVVAAAGSLPGDLHKLWRTRDPKGYHVEYGYSCMGYEIPGGIGAKLAAPDRGAFVLVSESDPLAGVPNYGSWWEVVPAEVSDQEAVRKARQEWAAAKKGQRRLL